MEVSQQDGDILIVALEPGFPIWTPLGYSPSDNSPILTKSCVKLQYVVFVVESTFCDFAEFLRLVFYGLTEFGVSRWARHAV